MTGLDTTAQPTWAAPRHSAAPTARGLPTWWNDQRMPCRGTTRTGAPCRHPVATGHDCGRHTPAGPSTATPTATPHHAASLDPFASPTINGRFGPLAGCVDPDLTTSDLATADVSDGPSGPAVEWRDATGGVIARASLDVAFGADDQWVRINGLEVHPDARGRGIAKAVLADLWHRSGGKTLVSDNGFTSAGQHYLSTYVLSLTDSSDAAEQAALEDGLSEDDPEWWDVQETHLDAAEHTVRRALTDAFGPARTPAG